MKYSQNLDELRTRKVTLAVDVDILTSVDVIHTDTHAPRPHVVLPVPGRGHRQRVRGARQVLATALVRHAAPPAETAPAATAARAPVMVDPRAGAPAAARAQTAGGEVEVSVAVGLAAAPAA